MSAFRFVQYIYKMFKKKLLIPKIQEFVTFNPFLELEYDRDPGIPSLYLDFGCQM